MDFKIYDSLIEINLIYKRFKSQFFFNLALFSPDLISLLVH